MRIRGLCKLPDGKNWLWGKLSLALVDRAMLNKSLIQLSAYEQGCAPPCLPLPPISCLAQDNPVLVSADSMVGLLEASKRTYANPCLCRRPSNTHRQVWLSLLLGHCSFPLGSGAHNILFLPSNSLCFAQACGSSVIKSCCPPKSISLGIPSPFAQSLSLGWEAWWGPRAFARVWELLLWYYCSPVCGSPTCWEWDLILSVIFAPLLLSSYSFSFVLGHGIPFFAGFQCPPVNGYSAASCAFGVLTEKDERTSSALPSWPCPLGYSKTTLSVFLKLRNIQRMDCLPEIHG